MFIIFFFHLRSMISILSDWVSFLAYPNLFGIKGFVVVVVVADMAISAQLLIDTSTFMQLNIAIVTSAFAMDLQVGC
jgi:hypothetical protein